jgi:hypothetical protein
MAHCWYFKCMDADARMQLITFVRGLLVKI